MRDSRETVPAGEHRIRTSPERHVPRAPADGDDIVRLARQAYHGGYGVYFTSDQLAAMPWDIRAFIEAQARRLYGPRAKPSQQQ